jgi:aminopeptidase N
MLAEDNTIPGNAAFQRGLAAQPSLAAKRKAWSEIYNIETGTQVRQALMNGFQRPSHRNLLNEFVDLYFGTLHQTWHEHGFEMASSIVKNMYPHHVITEEVLEKTDSWLSTYQDAPPALLRYLYENRDSLARSLKAQAKDISHQSINT